MSTLGEKRHLKFELLEIRAMLAGNVLVSVDNGDLQVKGDEQGNVLEFQQLSSSDPRAVGRGLSFQITPDADTSINGSKPGVGIVVAGVTRDIDVELGKGADELAVLGANGRQVRDLLIDAGSGPDAVSITRFRLSQDVRVSAADSLDLSVQRTSAADVFVKIDDIQGESKDEAKARTSSVTIRNSTLRGDVNVSNDVPLAVKIRGSGVGPSLSFPDVCKTPAPPWPAFSPNGNVNISSGAPLSVDIDQTVATNVSVKIDGIQGDSKDAAAASTSSVTIRNSRMYGDVNVSSEVPLAVDIPRTTIGPIPDSCKIPAPPAPFIHPGGNVNISGGAPLTVAMDRTRAVNVFVKIDDIRGESKDAATASTSSVTIRKSRLLGDVNVSSDVPLAVKIHQTFVGHSHAVKVPGTPRRIIVHFGGNVDISSGAPLVVAIDQTRAKGGVSIKAEGIPTSSDVRSSGFTNSIRIVDSVFGSLRIVGSELRDELEFVRLHVLGRSHIETGGGDDSLTAVDTVFGGFVFLDGGDDTDSLVLQGTRFLRGSRIVNWE